MSGILPLLILLPLIGGILLLTAGRRAELIPARRTSLAFSGMTLLLGLILASSLWTGTRFDSSEASASPQVSSEANPEAGKQLASIKPFFVFPTYLVSGSGDWRSSPAIGVGGG